MTKSVLVAALMVLIGCADEESPLPIATGEDVPSAIPILQIAKAEEQLLSWSFEPASADCNGWSVRGAEAIRASPPRSGSYSCKLCAKDGAVELALDRDVGAARRGHYVLSAWVRKRPQNEAPAEATARIEAVSTAGTRLAEAAPVAVREEWDRLEATLDLDDDASSLRISIGAPSTDPERCLFVDDVNLTRR